MHSTCTGPGLLSPVALLFNRPMRGLKTNLTPTPFDHDNDHYTALIKLVTKC